jgi:hypothetical protein
MKVWKKDERSEARKTSCKDLRAVCLMVRTKELLTHLYSHEMRVEMTVFVLGVKNCYNCGKMGHIKKVCKQVVHCFHTELPNTLGTAP